MSTKKSEFQQLTKNLTASKKLITGRTGQYTCMYCAWALFCRISSVSFLLLEHDGTIMGRETGDLSQIASTETEVYKSLTNFRAL